MRDESGDENKVDGARPCALAGDMNVTALGVLDYWPSHRLSLGILRAHHTDERNDARIHSSPWTAYYAGGSAYSAAKAGVHGFVRDVSLELAEYGITVNTVAPGPIDIERFGPGLKKLNETVEYSPNHMTPLKRLGQPFEVAHAVLFLASDEASYVTGHTLAVTGGR